MHEPRFLFMFLHFFMVFILPKRNEGNEAFNQQYLLQQYSKIIMN